MPLKLLPQNSRHHEQKHFCDWIEHFIAETEELLPKFNHIIVTMDVMGSYLSFRALMRLK